MALRINTNVAALNAHRNIQGTERSMGKNMERLSSGFRINHASDDAAGLSIANRFRSSTRSLTVASRNVTEGKSMVNVAEGAANQIEGILERLKELATQASSDNAATDRDKINSESKQLLSEITRIAEDTEYQGTKLITGKLGMALDATKSTADDAAAVVLNDGSIDVSGVAAEGTFTITHTAGNISITDGTKSQAVLTDGDGAQTVAFDDLGITLNLDSDYTSVSVDLEGTTIVTEDKSASYQVGSGNTSAEDKLSVAFGNLTAAGLGVNDIDLSDKDKATAALATIDGAVNSINTSLGSMGAAINRLDYTHSNLQTTIENFSASESVIRDVDMAGEMVSFTKNQILMQAGTAMLGQANMSSQGVLSLIG